jgi:hypothetical protein
MSQQLHCKMPLFTVTLIHQPDGMMPHSYCCDGCMPLAAAAAAMPICRQYRQCVLLQALKLKPRLFTLKFR